MTNRDYEFEGGDKLRGIHADYHHIMMKNELKNGTGAYKFSWAGGRSGPSFGGNQMDIAYNQHGIEVLSDIVDNALDDHGQPYFNKELKQYIGQIIKTPSQMKGKSAASVFGWAKINEIEPVLLTGYGKQRIHEAYMKEIAERINNVEKFIVRIKHGPGRKFADSRMGRCYIFDYGNQYGLSIAGLLHKHLNGEEVELDSGEIIPAFDKLEFTKDDFAYFLRRLKYYVKHAHDVERRLKNINDYLERKENSEKTTCLVSTSECIRLYEAYEAFSKHMSAANGVVLDTLAREFQRKYAGCNICDQCKSLYGLDFATFFPKAVEAG